MRKSYSAPIACKSGKISLIAFAISIEFAPEIFCTSSKIPLPLSSPIARFEKLRCSFVESIISAISLNLMPFAIMILPKSCTFIASAFVESFHSFVSPIKRPPSISIFCALIALAISVKLRLYLFSAVGLGRTLISRSKYPTKFTCPTPLIRWIKGLRFKSACKFKSKISCIFWIFFLLERKSEIIGAPPTSYFSIMGDLTSLPKLMVKTLSRTSFAAILISFSSSNSTTTILTLSALMEVIFFSDSTPLMASSILSVTLPSTTSGFAPG